MRLMQTPPPRCSSCFGAYPERQHVDFEAAYDGPVFGSGVSGEHGVENNIPVSIDDLMLCENCVKQAASLLGWVDPDETMQRVGDLEEANENLRETLVDHLDHERKLEAAIASKAAVTKRQKVKA